MKGTKEMITTEKKTTQLTEEGVAVTLATVFMSGIGSSSSPADARTHLGYLAEARYVLSLRDQTVRECAEAGYWACHGRIGGMAMGGTVRDAILALIPQAVPVWCPHCVYRPSVGDPERFGWWLNSWSVPDDWDQCPVAGCHAKRPEVKP